MKHDVWRWIAVLALVGCGASVAPSIPATAQVQDTHQITQNTQVIWSYGNHSILTTIYDDPNTDRYGDVICQTVIGVSPSSSAGNSSAVSCQALPEAR